MATKKQIAEQAMRVLAGGHLKPDRTMDIREVMLHLDQLRDARARLDTYQNVKEGTYEVDSDYLSFYESETLLTDSVKGLKYLTLPASTLSLPWGLELYQITPVADMENGFIIIPAGQMVLFRGSQALEHELKTYCWKVGNRVFFKNIDPAILEVTLLIVASSKDIAESADYPVPPDVEAELLQQLVQFFSIHQQQKHDELEDGQK